MVRLSKDTIVYTLFSLAAVSASPLSQKRALATVYSACTVPGTAAITFDDGPYMYLQDISDLLTNAGAKGTFFFNGNNYDCIYDADSIARVKYAYQAGHQIGDHTWAHADLTTLSTVQIEDAMFRVEEALSRILGIKPAFMRPPYGAYNDDVRQIAAARGQNLALWDWDTGDSDGNSTTQSEAVYQDAVNAKVSSMLVLNHETKSGTASTVIPFAIKLLQKNGYKLVTLAECLGVEPYNAIGLPQKQTAAWTCDGTPGPGKGCTGTQCETGTPIFSSTTAGPSPTNKPPTPPPTQTNLFIHPNSNTKKCLAAASNSNSAAVEIEDCNPGSAAQSWTLKGFNVQIFNNKCLDVTNGSGANGNKMQIYTCSAGSKNQQWITAGTGNAIKWSGSSSCLDNTGGSLADGNVAQLWTCGGNANQKWTFASAGSPTKSSPTPAPPTSTGHVIHPGSGSTTCLSAPNNANSGTVVVEPCNGSASQKWIQNGGALQIYSNKCLDVTNGSTANGTKLQIYTCSAGDANQQFSVTSDHHIAWTNKGKCLDLTGGSLASGNQAQIWACTANDKNQVWNIV